jgi:Sec7-like guanine-nucleotide exchange factor
MLPPKSSEQAVPRISTYSGEPRHDIDDDSNGVKSDTGDQHIRETSEAGKGSIVGNFDRKQKAQEEIETGILKFNQSTKKGIAFLVERGHLQMDPQSVASFLRQYGIYIYMHMYVYLCIWIYI